jgi:hypothetical protein
MYKNSPNLFPPDWDTFWAIFHIKHPVTLAATFLFSPPPPTTIHLPTVYIICVPSSKVG